MLYAEARRTGSRLEGWLSHSHENPLGHIAVEHGTKSTDVMMALSILGPRHWPPSRPSCEEMKPAHEAHQPTEEARKPS